MSLHLYWKLSIWHASYMPNQLWWPVLAGRRDDLWSWLYVLTEMLDGGLCWRIGKDKAERQAQDASRRLHPKHVHLDKQRKKDTALKMKRAALADPDLLTANVVVPGEFDMLCNSKLLLHVITLGSPAGLLQFVCCTQALSIQQQTHPFKEASIRLSLMHNCVDPFIHAIVPQLQESVQPLGHVHAPIVLLWLRRWAEGHLQPPEDSGLYGRSRL